MHCCIVPVSSGLSVSSKKQGQNDLKSVPKHKRPTRQQIRAQLHLRETSASNPCLQQRHRWQLPTLQQMPSRTDPTSKANYPVQRYTRVSFIFRPTMSDDVHITAARAFITPLSKSAASKNGLTPMITK